MAIKKEDEDYILDGTKIEWYPDRVSKWLEGKRIAPVTIDMALTQACNFQCVYCYAKLQKQNEKFKITKEVITSFLDDCKEIGVKGVSLVSDGESSISPVFEHAITYGYDRGIAMAVGTNGYLCTTPVLEKIMPCLTYIRFNASAGEEGRYAEIMGVDKSTFRTVKRNIKEAVRIRKQGNLCVSIGIQMVFMPQFVDQVIPLAELAIDLGVDYLQIKHCSDNESGELGVDYGAYGSCFNVLKKAESMSTSDTLIKVKWSKIIDGNVRSYKRCYGPPFHLQISGTGLVAPCGMLFNDKYKKYHIGNITKERFLDICKSEKYWNVMEELSSNSFNAQTMCGTLCLQHSTNKYLDKIVNHKPDHIEFL
jgi:MoaA/NifB/PqqE/SkfB family radical SAM enzyme